MSEKMGTHVETLQTEFSGGASERVVAGSGQLTIATIAGVARQIREALAEADTAVIDLADTVEVDVTALQLFCSACMTAAATGKQITYRGPLPQSLVELAAAAGLAGLEHCRNNTITCFRNLEERSNGQADNDH